MIYLYDGTATDFTYNGQPLPKARNTLVDYLINDEFYVTFKYPLDKDNIYKQIEKDKIITAHTPDGMQPFRIIDRASHANYIEVEAWPLFYADMRRKSVRPLALRNATGHTAIKQFLNNLLIDTPFEITTNITETHDYHTQDETERENNPNQYYDALEVFKAIVNRWNGEVFINGYDVRVVDRIGVNKEALLYEEKNIAEFVDKESMAELVTRLHGKAQWTEDRDDGEQIEHSIQTTVDSPLIDAYSGVVFEKQYTNNDLRTEQELQNWLNLMFTTDNVDKPTRNIEVGTNVIDGQSINAGDGLVLKYIKHDVDMQIRMVGYQYDGFADRYIKVYLGDAKDSLTGSLKNSISDVENNVNNNVQQIAHTIINSMGQKLIYSETEPQGNFREGDTWFDNQGGMFFWDEERADWIPHPYNRRTDVVEQLLQEAQQDIAEAQAAADNAITEIEIAVENAGFTTLDETISSVQSISNAAQASADVARDHALDALSGANTAMTDARSALNGIDQLESTVADINIDIDEINGTLSLKADSDTVNVLDGTVSNLSTEVGVIAGELNAKADSSLVDTISGIVDNHTLDIRANAEGLALKANQDTVDTLAGTVSSLGTEFDAVAGQVNSRVWNTDIKSAIDDIEVGGRNLLINSTTFERPWNTQHEKGHDDVFGGTEAVKLKGTEWLGYVVYHANMSKFGPDNYVFSFWAKTTNGGTFEWGYRNGSSTNHKGNELTSEWKRYVYKFSTNNITTDGRVVYLRAEQSSDDIYISHPQLEKGTILTDHSLAPEDTLARFDHIETEWTQTFDSFKQTVSSIDGRVTAQMQTIDRITDTVSDHTGRISTTERNINGLQDTVSDPVNGLVTQVSTLASGFNVLASDLEDMEVGGRNLLPLSNGNLKAYTPYNSSWFVEGTLIATSINSSANTLNLSLHEDNLSETLSEGEVHTISGFIRVNGQIPAKNIFINNRVDTYLAVEDVLSFHYNPDTGFFVTTVPKARNSWIIHARTELVLGDVLTIDKMKIEKGTIATDWTPAPEDMATQAQFSVLNNNINMRVSKNDVINQINISTEGILLDAAKVHIGSTTTIDDGILTNRMIAANAQIDGAKIGNATISSAKIISLDVNQVSGLTSNFVQSYWNSATGGSVQATGDGILTTASDGSQTYIQDGIVGTRNPSGATIGSLGYSDFDGSPVYTLSTSWGSHFRIMQIRENTDGTGTFNRESFYLQAGGWDGRINTNRFEFDGKAGVHFYNQPVMYTDLAMNGRTIINPYGINFTNGGYLRTISNGSTRLSSSGTTLQLGVSSSWKFEIDSTRNYMHQPLSMEGNQITNSPSVSDIRWKDVLGERNENDLDKLMRIEYVDFNWKEDGRFDFGFIAQQVENIVPEIMMDVAGGFLGFNDVSYMHLIGHSVQQLAIQHENTLELASAAYIAAEDHETRIEKLEKENRELKNEIEELKGAA